MTEKATKAGHYNGNPTGGYGGFGEGNGAAELLAFSMVVLDHIYWQIESSDCPGLSPHHWRYSRTGSTGLWATPYS